jgi:hypothetical protein
MEQRFGEHFCVNTARQSPVILQCRSRLVRNSAPSILEVLSGKHMAGIDISVAEIWQSRLNGGVGMFFRWLVMPTCC